MHKAALYAFHLVYFATFSVTTFFPRYFAQIGLSDAQIGMLLSLPAVVGVLVQPMFGLLLDRARLKKQVMAGLLFALTVVCLWMGGLTGFGVWMASMTIYSVLQMPVASAYSAISLEYGAQTNTPYGPVRLVGTIGYQLGALAMGLLFRDTLGGLFVFLAALMCCAGVIGCAMPPVRGHQHDKEKRSMVALLKDRRMGWLLAMVLMGSIGNQFYLAFFSKHMGELGIGNGMTGLLIMLSVLLEMPFLLWGDRLARKTSVWNWMMVGFLLNAVRWIALAVSRSALPLMLAMLPTPAQMACFEFFPALYINKHAPDALKGSAQNALMIVGFGVSKVIGGLVGGFAVEWVGIPWGFAGNGLIVLAALAAFYRPSRRLHQRDLESASRALISNLS